MRYILTRKRTATIMYIIIPTNHDNIIYLLRSHQSCTNNTIFFFRQNNNSILFRLHTSHHNQK